MLYGQSEQSTINLKDKVVLKARNRNTYVLLLKRVIHLGGNNREELGIAYCEKTVSYIVGPLKHRKHFPVLSLFLTYYRVCNQINTMGATSGAGTAYPSGELEFTPGFQWGSCYSIFFFMFYLYVLQIVVCPFVLFRFGLCVVITSLVSSNSSYHGIAAHQVYIDSIIHLYLHPFLSIRDILLLEILFSLSWNRHKHVVGLNRLMRSQPATLDNWNFNVCIKVILLPEILFSLRQDTHSRESTYLCSEPIIGMRTEQIARVAIMDPPHRTFTLSSL